MAFVVGFVLFAVCITLSVALHECGHMWAAQATGMKVRRYFIGFGPTIFSFRRGETEYGLKALPLGGFCDIAGMTALDEVPPEDLDRAMYRQATWKRLVVMFGGIFMNFVLGFLLIVVLAVGWGLPSLDQAPATAIGAPSCVQLQNPDGTLQAPCTGEGPAQKAGLQRGDIITKVNDVKVTTWQEFVAETQKQTLPFQYTFIRDGETLTRTVEPQLVMRYPKDAPAKQVGAVGVGHDYYEPVKYGVLAAIPASVSFTGEVFGHTVQSLMKMPEKIPALWNAVTGGERDPETPVSVYGASRIGGESVEIGQWQIFVMLLASLNIFLGMFNLLPLLPLDGGHIAVVLYEKIRNSLRARRGEAPGLPVNYLKLLPVTYVVIVIGGAYMLLTLSADILNPITLR